MSRYCLSCEKEETKVLKKTGKHTWGKWETTEAPDCMNAGKAVRYCKGCDASQTKKLERKPSAHSYGLWYVTKKSTAFSTGTKERTCYICQKVQKKSIAKLKTSKGTTKSEKQALKAATFFSHGSRYVTF